MVTLNHKLFACLNQQTGKSVTVSQNDFQAADSEDDVAAD